MAGDDRTRTTPPRPLFTVAEAALAVGGQVIPASETAGRLMITGVESDSRYLRPGDLFCALPGERVDGHHFVGAALADGAAAALVDVAATRDGRLPAGAPPATGAALIAVDDVLAALTVLARRHRQRFAPAVVGITGSVGKTTTKDLMAATLGAGFTVLATRGNLNTDIGLALTLFELGPEHEVACLEMGMRGPGQIERLAALARPSVGVITNIGPVHIELLGSVDAIAQAKEELLWGLAPEGTAILNADDPRLAEMAGRHRDRVARVMTYGLANETAHLRGRLRDAGAPGGSAFDVVLSGDARDLVGGAPGLGPFTLPLEGRHNVLNALAALGVGLTLGLSPDLMREGLARVTLSAMRQEIWEIGGVRIVNDAYNAGPASMDAALELLASLRARRGGRAVAVLGDMLELGPLAEATHREVGRQVAALRLDLVFCVGPLSAVVADEAVRAGLPAARVAHQAGNDAAAEALLREVRPGDTILLKASRGMRFEEIATRLVAGLGSGPGGGEREQL